jgi:hypothetical protein
MFSLLLSLNSMRVLRKRAIITRKQSGLLAGLLVVGSFCCAAASDFDERYLRRLELSSVAVERVKNRIAAYQKVTPSRLTTVLEEAVKNNDADVAQYLKATLSADEFCKQIRPGISLLELALAKSDLWNVFNFIVGNKIGVEAVNLYGQRPIHLLTEEQELHKLRMLIDLGKVDVNSRMVGRCSGTALHIAGPLGNLEIVTLLLSRRADPTLVDTDGATPLGVCTVSFETHRGWMSAKDIEKYQACITLLEKKEKKWKLRQEGAKEVPTGLVTLLQKAAHMSLAVVGFEDQNPESDDSWE